MGGSAWVVRLASLLALGLVLGSVEASLVDIDPRYRTCVRECQTTGVIGENIISHCQSKDNDTSVGGSWYNQEQIYMQWKQLNCRTDCRYFCMMRREGERQSLGLSSVKYHGKWPFLRVSVFQEPLSAALSAVNLLMHFTGWLPFFLLVNYKLPLRPQIKRTYYEYTSLCRHPSRLELWTVIFGGALAMLLELYDFPPYMGYADAHSLWHASIIPLTYLWWSFIKDDAEFRPSTLMKKANANIHLEAPSELLVDSVAFLWTFQKGMGTSCMRGACLVGGTNGDSGKKVSQLGTFRRWPVIYVTETEDSRDIYRLTEQFTVNIMQNFLGSSVGSKYGFTTLQSSVQVSSSK
ncbi:post-GPI attachment to proteins factor 3-like [Panicum miliaceum]|uniref:Post-GPI attachment to proteins factor 3 n=1 Tax=Panicum miliaceum TaxID=4540 RepID=A0A3L6T186_PANMI|nr:post-GPI attachment to proteins factor 3-like [Panicum miliaceum]